MNILPCKRSHFLSLLEIQLQTMVHLLTLLLHNYKAFSMLRVNAEPLSLQELGHWMGAKTAGSHLRPHLFYAESCQNVNTGTFKRLRYTFTFHFNGFYFNSDICSCLQLLICYLLFFPLLLLWLSSVRKTDQKLKKRVGSGQGNIEEQFCRK